jgi:hypothetical protein
MQVMVNIAWYEGTGPILPVIISIILSVGDSLLKRCYAFIRPYLAHIEMYINRQEQPSRVVESVTSHSERDPDRYYSRCWFDSKHTYRTLSNKEVYI